MERVAVFIDYENVHRTGHQVFAELGEARYDTVVCPIAISERIVQKRSRAGTLAAVHVFRGRPVPEFQPRPASANDIQAAAWELDERVKLMRRDLKNDFEDGVWVGSREKGIDVALAVSLVETAMLNQYDVAVVFSSDTDLLPAVELAYTRTTPNVEIACWSTAKPLWFPDGLRQTPPKRMPYCHFLDGDDFRNARDFSAVDC